MFGSLFFPVVSLMATLSSLSIATNDLKALDGDWIYVEDRTEGRTLEQLGPPMSSKFSFRTEEGAVILASGHGSGLRNVRVALDGTTTETKDTESNTIVRHRASWKDGTLTTDTDFKRGQSQTFDGVIRREFQITPDGLIVRLKSSNASSASIGLYRHPQDIPMPTPAKATISDLKWLEGAWVGTRSSGSTFEERWTPPKGGAMLATSRSVNASGKMFAFEFLRIVEREGGLIYIAQPGGTPPTEFVLTELTEKRAVFENPRHDYPKRIVYELTAEGDLTATIGYTKGGTPRRFDFKREGG